MFGIISFVTSIMSVIVLFFNLVLGVFAADSFMGINDLPRSIPSAMENIERAFDPAEYTDELPEGVLDDTQAPNFAIPDESVTEEEVAPEEETVSEKETTAAEEEKALKEAKEAKKAEEEALKAEIEKKEAEEAKKAAEEAKKAEEEKKANEAAKKAAEEKKAEEEKKAAEEAAKKKAAEEKKALEEAAASAKTEVSRVYMEDCGSDTGYWMITYSDGSVEYIDE